uniref:Ran GTPase-activating protein 1 n=1 Tax=Panagrolaimus sp. PS1159 TaxID=55785 RepID=A0AC35GBW4_9BILA
RLNNLVCVNFSDCLCRAKGCLNIVYELVNANSSVQELLLGGNEIDADTMQKISQLSIQLPSLKNLALGSNNLGSKFDTIKRHFKNEIIDFGEESDDQGTLSASEEENIEESESDGGEEENGASGEDDWDNDEEFLASFVDKDIMAALGMLTVEEGQTLSYSNEASKRWDTVEDGKRVAAKILETKRIHTLDLSGNTLGVQASGPIAEALKKHPELKIAQW